MSVNHIEYRYRPYLRPVGFATLPRDVKWDYVEAPSMDSLIAVRRGIPLSTNRYGIITLDRQLTADEREQFGMEAL